MIKVSSENGLASIIIPCWNAAGFTQRCLESVWRWTSHPYELIAVDNGSHDATGRILASFFNRFKKNSKEKASRGLRRFLRLRNAKNLGFAKAINQGMQCAAGGYMVWLNNDTVVTPHWLERLVSGAETNRDIGAVGPRIYRLAGAQAVAQVNYRNLDEMPLFSEAWALRNSGRVTEVPLLLGCCLLLKRSVIARIGMVEEGFGLGNYEDFDLCLRALQAGYRLVIAEDVFLHHDYHATFQANSLDFNKEIAISRQKFRDKWRKLRVPANSERVDDALASMGI